jgi:hypothetical protein
MNRDVPWPRPTLRLSSRNGLATTSSISQLSLFASRQTISRERTLSELPS